MEKNTRLKEKIRYRFDNFFSRGTWVMIIGLGFLSLGIILLAAIILYVGRIGPNDVPTNNFFEAMWLGMVRTLDAGTMGADQGWGFRLVMFILPTLGGIFIISTLIGVLSSGIEGKLDDLRKGRSKVIENGHIVILGWSEQVFTIISELMVANENVRNPCIVVMAERDKVEMDDLIRQRVGKNPHTRVVCRSGNPVDLSDLEMVSLETSRAVIVLSPDCEDPDSEVIKEVLAITNHPKRRTEPYHIVAELREAKTMEVAFVIGKDEVEWILVGDFIARMIAQTCRQSGLSVVYTELLDFEGDEMYFYSSPALVGKKFQDCLHLFEKNVVMGIHQSDKTAQLNAPPDTVIQQGDQLVVMAEDDDQIFLDGKQAVDYSQILDGKRPKLQVEKTLMLGWNWRALRIIHELENYVSKGSELHVVADKADLTEILKECCRKLVNQKLTYRVGDTTDRSLLESIPLEKYDHVILLCYSDNMNAQQADSKTLITLLHLRDIAEKRKAKYSIVSEMLDIRNRNLADVTRADDFIVSDKLVSLLMTQVAENKYVNAVFKDIFDPEGSEIYLKPATWYIKTAKPVNFYTVVESARKHNELAIGYQIKAQAKDPLRNYGIYVNPRKSDLIPLSEKDKIIVVAEN